MKHERVVVSLDDFVKFFGETSGRSIKKAHVLEWMQVNQKKMPAKYPCFVMYEDEVVEDDDVGFGSHHETNFRYQYVRELEARIEELNKRLAQMKVVK